MADDRENPPFYAPNARAKPREARPGRVMWVLEREGETIRCELRDDTRVGAGVDVQLIEPNGWVMFSQRCVNQAGAEFVAASYRRDHLRDGWTDTAEATKLRW